MKKYLPIILLLIALLMLPSCVGIGDGALFDNITTREKEENGVIAPGSAAFCQIYPGMSPGGTVMTNSAKSVELLLKLSVGEYLTEVDRTTVEKPYFELIYPGTEGKHYVIYEDDFVFEKSYELQFDTHSSHDLVSLGQLPGAYVQAREAYLDTLDQATEEELSAGCKLNCLQVVLEPEISRAFDLSDFEDIGGFYLLEISSQPSVYSFYNPAEQFIVYFKSCTPGELEEKIALLKKNSVVKSVEKIVLVNLYSE